MMAALSPILQAIAIWFGVVIFFNEKIIENWTFLTLVAALISLGGLLASFFFLPGGY